MSKWVEVNKNGVVETNSLDEQTGLLTVCKSEDVEPLIDRNKELANTRATDIGIKKGLWHYASIPVTIQYELLTKFGLSIHNRHHFGQILEKINSEYPALKTTHKTHSVKRNRSSTKGSGVKHGPSLIVR
jgi:hypothetical protein